ncbi:hypothetical protein BKA93DRAFT_724934 [Sparassis latifolia]
MASSLAAQLAQGASLNASLLVDSSRRKSTESYLFSAKEAFQHDLDSLHALGVNGFLQLKSMNPVLRYLEQTLFSDAAKSTDRTLQAADANAKLDEQIAAFLPLLGPFLMDAPTGKVLEWLVRRFRINEFNVKHVLALFLPYHESPHFAKMVTILHIPDQSVFRFLLPYKKNVVSLPRSALVAEMSKNSDFARFVLELLPKALREDAGLHRALVAFHTGLSLDFVAHQQTLDEGAVAFLLPAFVEPLQFRPNASSTVKPTLIQESTLGSYLLLAATSQKCHLSSKALKAVLSAISSSADRVSPKQFVRTLVAVCAPQDELEALPRNVMDTFIQFSGIDDEVRAGLSWVGAEKLVNALITSLVKHLDRETLAHLLESILTSTEVSSNIVRHATTVLLRHATEVQSTEGNRDMNTRRFLSHIQQRHPKTFEQVCHDAMKQDEDQREAIEQIIVSLTVVSSMSSHMQDLGAIVASISADENSRALAVRDLLNMLSNTDLSVSDRASVASTLLSRAGDTSAAVIEALYAQPSVLLPVLLGGAAGYISSLTQALHPKRSPARNLIRLHVTFVTNYFFSVARAKDEGLATTLFYQVVFPFLLFSKPKQKTTSMVWNIIEEREKDRHDVMGIGRYSVLGGCVDAVRWEQAKQDQEGQYYDEDRHVELLTKLNLALTSKLADNVAISNNFAHHLDALLSKLHETDLYSRNLSYLVIRALLSRLSKEHRWNVAYRVLEAMKLESLEGMSGFMRGVDNLQVFLQDASLVTAVVLKPSSQHTLHRLQVAVLSVLSTIPPPAGVVLNWLATPRSAQDGIDVTEDYVRLMRAMYKLSNSTSSLPLLSTHILRMLFINLGDEALAFLAGVWINSLPNGKEDAVSEYHICHAALRHAVAFLNAHHATGHCVDFQTVLPALIVCLQSSEGRVREEASACLESLKILSSAKGVSSVYAYDKIYGPRSASLQYLGWGDFCKYVNALVEARHHFLHDGTFIAKFHAQYLSENKTDSKKQAGRKQRIMCYLLSHVNACPALHVQRSLLKSLELAPNMVKSQVLLPTLQKVLDKLSRVTRAEDVDQLYQDFSSLIVSSFDRSAASDLNDQSKPVWSTFEQVLTVCFSNESFTAMKLALVSNVQSGLFAKLSAERKVDLCRVLLEIGGQQANSTSDCKRLLTHVVTEVPLMIRLLVLLQPTAEETGERASKRVRLEDTSPLNNTSALPSLCLLAEILASISLPGSLDLMTCLLETLNKVTTHATVLPAEKSYVEQLLMTALDSTISSMPENSKLPAGSVRVDVLVELIRVSENPQTSHQALLLMSNLARLTPDAILHNVMPVFTFMGSNVFHRDDTYSFGVVQRTIDSIVPVMAASLKDVHAERLELYIAAREFLRIFTDASNHIPRHRRAHLFSHLVDVLGPEEFLPPVCMLLVDRMTNRVVRQNFQDARITLSLPLNIVQHYPAEQRLSLLVEMMHESQRLLGQGQETFLYTSLEDETPPTVPKRKVLALLVFTDHTLKDIPVLSSSEASRARILTSEVLSLLLGFTVLGADESLHDLTVAARTAMASTLQIMSAGDFIAGILTMIESPEVKIQTGALELLGERLTNISDQVRRESTPSIVMVVDIVRQSLTLGHDVVFVRAAFHALRAISQTACPDEENALTSTVPLVLIAAKQQETASIAFNLLQSLCSTLGPRIIPYLKEIVQVCVTTLHYILTGTWSKHIPKDAFTVVHTLLTTIPTFWSGQELTGVVNLYLDFCVTASSTPEFATMTSVVKTLAKHVPSKVLLPTLCAVWSSTGSESQVNPLRCIGFFSLMKRSIRAATRPLVLDHLRLLFETFHDAFNMNVNMNIETDIISSFVELVVKLNETAFRPLFRKLCDWAFASDNDAAEASRQVRFCHIYIALLNYFKGLMIPYMSFVWQPVLRVFEGFVSGSLQDSSVWIAVLQTITSSLAYDEGSFWRDRKLGELVSIMSKQVPVCVQLNAGKIPFLSCLTATMGTLDDDTLLKSMNLDILMESRSEDPRIRQFSLSCSEALWRAHGSKLLGFAEETSTFLVECAEDENDNVVREALKLKSAVEGIAGRIDAS